METSRLGTLFIARREALVLTAYQDGEHYSIGFGHNGPEVEEDDKVTIKRAFQLLRDDIRRREPTVRNHLDGVAVKQHEWDALVSLYYQGGSDGLRAVCEHIKRGDLTEASEEFLEWDTNAKGEHLPGLMKRRRLEANMFLYADYGELSPLPYYKGNPRTTKREEYHLVGDEL